MINYDRVKWHLTLPVCRTKRGLRTHIAGLNILDCLELMEYLGCTHKSLLQAAWDYIKGRLA